MAQEIALTRTTALRPQSLGEAIEFAKLIAKSRMVPTQYQNKPEDILIAIQLGAELGLAPLQSLQNVATINGKPSIYGDAALALCKASPVCEDVEEWIEGEGDQMTAFCTAKRVGKKPVPASFSVPDARKAGLWGKAGPWQQYPRRMLQMRARGFALRDAFPDVLKGLITAEEAQDYPIKDVTPAKPDTVAADLDAFAYNQETGEIEVAQPEPEPPLGDRATTAAGFGMKGLEDFWRTLSRDDKLALQPHLPALKERAAKADNDTFGLPPSAQDRPAGSPPSASALPPADDAGVPRTPPGEPTPEHAAARDPQQPPSERKDDADRPVAARGSAETAPPRAPIEQIAVRKESGKPADYEGTADDLLQSIGELTEAADIPRWRTVQMATFRMLPLAARDRINRALDEKAGLLAMGDGR